MSPAWVIAMLLLAFNTQTAHAQFFKDVLNTVKQTAQGRANGKASQATNTAIDKTTGIPTSGTTKTPDTSAAGMMKMLGVMTGGGGISAAGSSRQSSTRIANVSARTGYWCRNVSIDISTWR